MDCRTGPTTACRGIAVTAAAALCIAGCGGHSNVRYASTTAPGAGVSSGATVNVQGTSTLGALIAIGVLAGYAYESERQMGGARSQAAPPMEAARSVNEQDCSQPIENWTANLKCR